MVGGSLLVGSLWLVSWLIGWFGKGVGMVGWMVGWLVGRNQDGLVKQVFGPFVSK